MPNTDLRRKDYLWWSGGVLLCVLGIWASLPIISPSTRRGTTGAGAVLHDPGWSRAPGCADLAATLNYTEPYAPKKNLKGIRVYWCVGSRCAAWTPALDTTGHPKLYSSTDGRGGQAREELVRIPGLGCADPNTPLRIKVTAQDVDGWETDGVITEALIGQLREGT